MDIEFHYHMTYLIAVKAGFKTSDALVLAHSCQYVDDNDTVFEIQKGQAEFFKNYISQTMNILKPKPRLFRIYPVFHFVPGDPLKQSAYRNDGRLHWLNTTPNSENARRFLEAALASGDLYRMGIACHGYADTWAHQNFVGYFDEFNSMTGLLESALPNIGHADARHDPDWPALVWKDRRLYGASARVDNTARFMAAARHLFRELRGLTMPDCKLQVAQDDEDALVKDLQKAIGDRDATNEYRAARIARYNKLAASADYDNSPLPEYDDCAWMEEAVNEQVRGLRDRSDSRWARWDPLTDVYTWRDRQKYTESHWYRFQNAVKAHQAFAIETLNENLGTKMKLDAF